MQKLPLYQVDAFTDELFKGNPAAVCLLKNPLEEHLMQDIAAENNLAETAFILPKGNDYEIRWFTPELEVDLCGHATLASAYVIFNQLGFKGKEITFQTLYSGILKVTKAGELLTLNFPSDTINKNSKIKEVSEAIGSHLKELYKGKNKLLAILNSEQDVKMLTPDFNKIKTLDAMGVIVSATGETVDFVSRFFVPQVGINEDPVTGSAHTLLAPYWAKKLNKSELSAKQLSKRGGTLNCKLSGDRVFISGRAKLYLEGTIFIQ